MINQEQIIKVIAEALGVNEKNININSKSIEIPEWDSLGHLSILSAISQNFEGKYKESQELASTTSIKEIVDCLNK
jgi:acyl carrier protein